MRLILLKTILLKMLDVIRHIARETHRCESRLFVEIDEIEKEVKEL
jgi:hypothetical protein